MYYHITCETCTQIYIHETKCVQLNKECDITFYVAPVNTQAILGLNDDIHLDVVKRASALQPDILTKDAIRDNYPNCFKGLGNLET